jgi:Tfp pilus assembly PilM family ATPase/Tfp pilus assembly protein PilN
VNLKQRLSSTENLLRAIRSGESYATPQQPEGKGSIWTRKISIGDLFRKHAVKDSAAPPPPLASPAAAPTGKRPDQPPTPAQNPAHTAAATAALSGRQKPSQDQLLKDLDAAAARPPAAKKPPFWQRQIRFGARGKALRLGVSTSGPYLCLALVRAAGGALLAARRFSMAEDQAPGEKGFAEFLRASVRALGPQAMDAEVWAVLRSSDLDLNVLAVPKLSGSRLDTGVYWTLQKEKKFVEAEYVLDYLVLGPNKDAKEPRLDVLTCLARRADVDRLRDAFKEAGLPLTGITAIPNAFLNLYRLPGAPRGHALAANIHVEPDFSAIGLYTQDRLVFSRFIRSGAGSMADALADHFQELSRPRPVGGGDLELPLPGELPAASAATSPIVQPLDPDQALELLRHVLLGAPKPNFAQPAHLLSPEKMLEVVSPAIERLARQVERTLDYYATSQQARCDAMHLSGDIFTSPVLAQELGSQLGYTPQRFDAVEICPAGGANVATDDRMVLGPAVAAALSQTDRGINLLSTYKTRTAEEAKRKATQGLLLGLAALFMVIGACGLFLEHANKGRRAALAAEKAKLAALGPMPDENTLMTRLTMFKIQQDGLRQVSKRFEMPVILSELAQRIPENVHLLSIAATLEPTPAKDAQGKPKPPAPAKAGADAQPTETVSIEGIVTGDKGQFDATLARFVIELEASPLFTLPKVSQTEMRELDSEGQALYFVLSLGVK